MRFSKATVTDWAEDEIVKLIERHGLNQRTGYSQIIDDIVKAGPLLTSVGDGTATQDDWDEKNRLMDRIVAYGEINGLEHAVYAIEDGQIGVSAS